MKLEYPCILESSRGEGVALTFPDVPEAITGGETEEEALALAEDCLSTGLAFYLEEKLPLPVQANRSGANRLSVRAFGLP